ncbi:hypothetical protein CO2235_U720010 [Cupriavidus oxalaticus]|uniref:Uncharacterized protein n=1 Tax=Cupriavidus oxalaticus TaxID=96344 RepID=A0A375FR01_9BURK|nr:hypothetical protein CO2235_U720010 [Cupriavidus oxalaticus]
MQSLSFATDCTVALAMPCLLYTSRCV